MRAMQYSPSNSMKLYRAFRRTMAKHRLPRADSHLLIAFSGGADSTALLHLASTLCHAQRQQPRITALHVNHGIRGAEADRDARFCRQFCEAHDIPFVLFEADAPAEAAERHVTLEEAARDIRYRLITQYLSDHPHITAVLTAHHADDQTETVLFRLLRGTSLHGLGGIPEVREIAVSDSGGHSHTVPLIRPLLAFSKAELCAYLEEQGLSYVTDSTNAENDASRNLLRNTLIPAARRINSAFPDALRRLSRQASEDEDYFSSQVRLFFEKNSVSPLDPIPTVPLCECHRSVRRRILASVYDAHRAKQSDLKPLTAVQTEAMLHALDTGGKTRLSDRLMFSAEDGLCRIQSADTAQTIPQDYRIPLIPGEITPLPDGNSCLFYDGSVKSSENLRRLKNIYKLFISTHINSDKLIDDVYLRPRCDNQTDRYLCGGSHKTAKDALSAHGVPAHLRKTVPLFCDGGGILWIPHCGIRDSVNPKQSDRQPTVADLYYFYNDEVFDYASRY